MVNNKHAFWMALVFTIVVFVIGVIFGFFLETNRANILQTELMKSEISLLDQQIEHSLLINSKISCELGKASVFGFADKIYFEAQQLEKYDSSSKFTDTLKIVHKRYDLLRMLLWDEVIQIKKNCGSNFHTFIYFFNYNSDSLDIRAQQLAFSRMLTDLKNKHPDKILLIPIAANLDLSSVNIAMIEKNVTKAPSILIDENIIINQITSLEEIENIVLQSNKE